jgi:oxygen-independent coproporphyrinogen-3 oxidase
VAGYLYIHVPFCVRKCIYCDFISFRFDEKTAEDYAGALCKELILRKTQADELKTVYVGGGTPSLMPGKFFIDLFSCLRENFRIRTGAEITVEANPGTLSGKKLDLLHSLGVNRVSLGIQSLQDGELTALGRIHTARQATTSFEMAREAGFENISIDLMYGTPGQTVDTWHDTLRRAVQLGPTHISAYELTPETGTPFSFLLGEGRIELPDEEEVLEMYDHAIDYLSAYEYAQYEISNFALPGYRCLHNVNYWNRGEYLAAGAGAHSFIGGVRSRNTGTIPTYVERLKADMLPGEDSSRIPDDEAMRERLFLGLRKAEGIPLENSSDGSTLSAASELIEMGYLEMADAHLRFTRRGMVLSNTVIVTLFEKLGL